MGIRLFGGQKAQLDPAHAWWGPDWMCEKSLPPFATMTATLRAGIN